MASIASKKSVLEDRNYIKIQTHLKVEKRKEKDSNKLLLKELINHFDGKTEARASIKRWNVNISVDDDLHDEPFTESQEELLGVYVT